MTATAKKPPLREAFSEEKPDAVPAFYGKRIDY
jgi:hypothetical protein